MGSRTKLCRITSGKQNVCRIALQEFDNRNMFYNTLFKQVSVAQWLAVKISHLAIKDRFPGGQNICFLFNSDIVNYLLKTNGARDKA